VSAVYDDDRPVHRPFAPDAPIPGNHWYGGCDPDLPRVGADGVCEGCGAAACPGCGYEVVPRLGCGCLRNYPITKEDS